MDVVELGIAHRDGAVALWERCGLTRPWNPPERDFDDATVGPTSGVLGLLDGTDLVATAMVGFDGHRGWLYYVAVDPDRRSRGHGARIVRAAEGWLADHGARKVQLMVRRPNASAAAFYERLGYEDADTTVLTRWLAPPGDG